MRWRFLGNISETRQQSINTSPTSAAPVKDWKKDFWISLGLKIFCHTFACRSVLGIDFNFKKQEDLVMDQKTEVMVALGAAIGVNCIPCFDHLYSKAKEVKLTDEEVKQVVEIASKVKNGAFMFLKQAIGEVVGEVDNSQQPCCEASKSKCC
jgi:4-carboxymuconolactone decarboxylase